MSETNGHSTEQTYAGLCRGSQRLLNCEQILVTLGWVRQAARAVSATLSNASSVPLLCAISHYTYLLQSRGKAPKIGISQSLLKSHTKICLQLHWDKVLQALTFPKKCL